MTEQLNALDATFLELEEADESAHMHIGAVMVFEPPSGGGAPDLETLAAHLDRRLAALPRFRQRLSHPRTGGLRWPDWEEAPGFSAARHLRRAALPAPAGAEELLEWAGEFFSERLDRSRPLWEMVVLDGLSGGRWALATKTHHCMVDGVGSVDVGQLILDVTPDGDAAPAEPPPPPQGPSGAPARPGNGGGALGAAAAVPARLARAGIGLLRGGADVARHPERAADVLERSRAMATLILRDEVIAAPGTSLNTPIGGKRRLAVSSVPLDELKAVKDGLGGTVNDVVLAVAAGGLRRLLEERGDSLPSRGLRAMVPVNIRSAAEQLALGNKITSLFVHLPVDEPDPRERYRRQVEEAESLKSGDQALGSGTVLDLTSHAPPVIHSFLARSLFATRLFNLTITNVPGPQQPLFAFGSRMTEVWPLVPLAAEHAVALAVFSYDGRVFFAFNADSDSVGDLDVLARGAEEAFAELRGVVAAGG